MPAPIIETGKAVVSRANHHVTYPANFQLIAAMNPAAADISMTRRSGAPRRNAPSNICQNFGSYADRFDMIIEVQCHLILTDPVEMRLQPFSG